MGAVKQRGQRLMDGTVYTGARSNLPDRERAEQLRNQGGKGKNDRYVPLPPRVSVSLCPQRLVCLVRQKVEGATI